MPALAASLIAVKTASFVIPDAPLYSVPVYAISPDVYLWAVVASPFIGLWSVAFVRAIAWADRCPPVRLAASCRAASCVRRSRSVLDRLS